MVVTGRSRKAFAGNRTWVRIPPFPPISKIDLLLEVYFAIAKVGFERRAFPERTARKKKCEGRTIAPHLFRSSGGIRRRHFLKRQRGKRNARPDDWITTFSAQAVGFVAEHFLKRQRGIRNARPDDWSPPFPPF